MVLPHGAAMKLKNQTARRTGFGLMVAVLPGPDRLPGFFSQVLRQRLTVRGFIQTDFAALFPRFEAEMAQWLRDGRIQYREDIVDGLEAAPEAFFGLLQGRNFGKLVVKLD